MPSVALSDIGQIAIPIRDLDRAVAFYRDTLGMKFLFAAVPGLAFFDCGGVRLMLDKPGNHEGSARTSIIYYRVPDIEDAYRELQARSVNFGEAPHLIHKFPDHELWMCFFRDSEGNLLALMSEVRPHATTRA